ncbi:SURP and G-patch domain-containing protein 1-like [Panonychus citri]|uniref:SURP and G-patch domain-containing protein 1-like n=1 Tax=Panonychus citri TaxID=50023 RepID=UPI0023076967|nr:SURP and G-patch domain-containing protein 1-like [Panonychus citri]
MSNRYRNSRANRWEEITHQEQLILAKKREIEERLKSTDVSSCNSPSTITSSSSLPPSSNSSSSSSSHSQIDPITTTTVSPSISIVNDSNNSDIDNRPAFINRFSNDGSFMEMFKKMQNPNSSSSSPVKFVKSEEEGQLTPVDNEQSLKPKLEDIDERVKLPVNQDHNLQEEQQSKKVSPSGDDEIRMAIEKSAIYVAMNGSEAEARLKSDCINDSDYRWLYQEDNVNHQYYKRRVEELKEAKTRAADFELSASSPSTSTTTTTNNPEDTLSSLADYHDLDERNPIDMKGRKRKESRWSEFSSNQSVNEDDDQEASSSSIVPPQDPELIKYAIQVFGRCNLTAEQWKQLEDQRKMKVLVAMVQRKKAKRAKFEASGRPMYEYDSDEEVDGGTWEHKKRMEEMEKTREWADKITEMNKGKHHIGDFLPPDQLERFMKKWDSIKDGSTSILFDEDYQDFKLQSQNKGYKMLEKIGWSEGQGLGVDSKGTTKPVDADGAWGERAGLGQKRPDQLEADDDEYEAYRKRMMLAYRFRPNPLNNPRRPYY